MTLLVAILIATSVIDGIELTVTLGEQPDTHPSPQWASVLPLQFVSGGPFLLLQRAFTYHHPYWEQHVPV